MFIVGIQRPFYPKIEEVETIEEANILMEELQKENHFDDGTRKGTIYIAEVINLLPIKTHY